MRYVDGIWFTHFHEMIIIKLQLATVLFTYSKHAYFELILYFPEVLKPFSEIF